MTNWHERVDIFIKAFDHWLKDDVLLGKAIDKSINEGLFTRHDIEYGLGHLQSCTTKEVLTTWCRKVGVDDPDTPKTALCLHAGNIPMVGFQDILAVLLAGYNYAGKISKKDPYLLPGFLEALKQHGFSEELQYSVHLDDFKDLQADAVMFSGSGESAKKVKEQILKLNIASAECRFLIRTASFSMVYLDRDDEECLTDLAEAMLRYEGKGCRSIAIVVSPCNSESLIDKLGEIMELFWLTNPPLKQLTPKTKYRYAFNAAVGKKQYLFRHLLIQQNGTELDNDDVVYWVQGDQHTACQLAEINLNKLQNIYTVNPGIILNGFEDQVQPLSMAQKPDIDWKPDGIDPLSWLVSH